MQRSIFYSLIVVFFIWGCSEKKKQKANCPGEYLKDCVIIKIKKIQTTIQVDLDREKIADAGISSSTLQYKLQLADRNHQLRTVKGAERFVIEDINGKKHRLTEFAKVSLRIAVTYEYPWGTNPFHIQ